MQFGLAYGIAGRGAPVLGQARAQRFILGRQALLLFPQFVQSPYALHMMILFFLSVIMGESWNILGGYTGYINFGTGAFFAIGAYSTVVLHNLHAKPEPWNYRGLCELRASMKERAHKDVFGFAERLEAAE